MTDDELRDYVRMTTRWGVQLAFHMGYAAAADEDFTLAPVFGGIHYYHIVFRWYFGHGGSINLQAKAPPLRILGGEISDWNCIRPRDELRIVKSSERRISPYGTSGKAIDDCIEAAASVDSTLLFLFPTAKWENRLGHCASPFHNSDEHHSGNGYLLSEWAGRLLCESCSSKLAITDTVYHRTSETQIERSERDKMTPSLRWKILERDRFSCQSCGRGAPDVKMHVDHKIPIALGGKTEESNLHALCADCNLGKGAQMPAQATLNLWEMSA